MARIQNGNDDGVGTGFLVSGPDLHDQLPPLVLVTNGHVVPEDLDPTDAVVAFHGLDDDPGRQARFRVARQCWYEPSRRGLDTSILQLADYPPDVIPIPLASALPAKPLHHRRAYVIGHPHGLTQPQFSLQDNVLLDYDERVLHYRSPTEPGSSGSPVFDNEWRLIGLHHSGGAADAPAQQRRRHLRRQRGDHHQSHPRASGRATSRCEVTPAGRTPWDAPGWRQDPAHPPTGSSRRLPDRSARSRASAR